MVGLRQSDWGVNFCGLRCDGSDVTQYFDSASFLNDRIRFTLTETDDFQLRNIVSLRSGGAFRVRVLFDDGLEISSESTFVSNRSFSYRAEGHETNLTTVVLDAFDWTAATPGIQARCWVVKLAGPMFTVLPGNLLSSRTIHAAGATGEHAHEEESYQQLRLRGDKTYYCVFRNVHGEASWHLIVDTSDASSEHAAFSLDFLALQFAIGRRLSAPYLFAIGESGEVVGAIAGPTTINQFETSRHREAIPLTSNTCVALHCFERLSNSLRNETNKRLYVPISHYLDSIYDGIDGERIKLYIALESAFWIGKAGDHLTTPSPNLIRQAFTQCGLAVQTAMLNEISRERSRVVHTGMVLADPDAPIDVAALRAHGLFGLLLSRFCMPQHIGYDGEIWSNM